MRFRLVGVFRGSERVFGLSCPCDPRDIRPVTTSGAYPVAVAVICVDPMLPPVTCGFAVGTVRPAEMNMLAGTTVAGDVEPGAPGGVGVELIVTPPGQRVFPG